MKLFTSSVLVLLSVAASGCGSVVDSKGAGGDATSSSTASATSTSTSTTTPMLCGAKTCGVGEFCKDLSGKCGAGPSDQKSCVTIGTACSDGDQVCGCDGTIYMSEGCSNLSSVSVDVASKCATPTAMFPCGATYCASGGQLCRETTQPTMQGEVTLYACEALPAACMGTASCACVPTCEGAQAPNECTLDAAGNATLHCTIG